KEIAQGAGCSVNGGRGTFLFSYQASSNAEDFNSWAMKTTEVLPDGNQNIIYTNYLGQVMLKVFHHPDSDGSGPDTDQSWSTFYRFDDKGHTILQANPSAVTGYDDQYADLLHEVSGNFTYLDDDDGLVTISTYYTGTDALPWSAGGAA